MPGQLIHLHDSFLKLLIPAYRDYKPILLCRAKEQLAPLQFLNH